ncbi:unnamed protein product [Ilex paraguariensis]|uniref:Uncharacterized protein n=1 Tax=Ilex paraguariensis TaxID=185542 RepID=A0ABC8R5M3_9AQUA
MVSSCFFFVFFVLSHLVLLSSGQEKNQSYLECPVTFRCGSLSLIGFPFTSFKQPDCGLCMVNCDKKPFPTVQLDKNGRWYEARSILQITDSILVGDLVLDQLLNSRSCDFFNNITLPNSYFYNVTPLNYPRISFTISPNPNLILFKCINSPKHTLQVDEYLNGTYSYKHSLDFSVYYTYPSNPITTPNPSVLHHPQMVSKPNLNPNYSDQFALFTAEFSLQFPGSDKCSKCKHEGELCVVDSKNKFHCDKAQGMATFVLLFFYISTAHSKHLLRIIF